MEAIVADYFAGLVRLSEQARCAGFGNSRGRCLFRALWANQADPVRSNSVLDGGAAREEKICAYDASGSSVFQISLAILHDPSGCRR